MIKAVLFDLDNTLIDRQKAFKEMLTRVFSSYYSDTDYVKQLVDDMILFDDGGKIKREEAFSKLIDKYNIKDFTAKQLSDNWSKESGSTVYLFDDVVSTLKILKNKYKLAIVTNGDYDSQKRKLDNINLYDLLDYTLISSEIGYDKPDTRVFIHAVNNLHLKAEECIYVGDSYSRDIVGAINSGLRPIYISRNKEQHNDVKTIYSIKDLLQIL